MQVHGANYVADKEPPPPGQKNWGWETSTIATWVGVTLSVSAKSSMKMDGFRTGCWNEWLEDRCCVRGWRECSHRSSGVMYPGGCFCPAQFKICKPQGLNVCLLPFAVMGWGSTMVAPQKGGRPLCSGGRPWST